MKENRKQTWIKNWYKFSAGGASVIGLVIVLVIVCCLFGVGGWLLGTKFANNTLIETFDEFEEFDGVTSIPTNAFKEDTSLYSIKFNITSRYSKVLLAKTY